MEPKHHSDRSPLVTRQTLLPFILLTSCFAWWGLANNMTDTLLAAFQRIMSLSDFQTSWIQVAFYGSYFCLALPAALFIKRFSYRAGVLLGLGLFIAGALLFYPASLTMNYLHFLIALYVLAGGLSVLETSANPYIIAMGPQETATQRLNLAQSFNPLGSISGILISQIFILSHLNEATAEERAAMSAGDLSAIQSAELSAVMAPYVGVALLLLVVWLAIACTRMPSASDKEARSELMPALKRLARARNYRRGVIAQFFYVGAQIGVWSFTIRYVMQELHLNEASAATYYLAALILFGGFRFVSTYLMSFIDPGRLLVAMSGIAAMLTAVVAIAGGMVGVLALVGISACMSLMFPTIYGLAIAGLGDDTKLAGSGLIMAILGGAVLTAIQGQVSDLLQSIQWSFMVPLGCFLVVLWYAATAASGSVRRRDQAV